MKLDRRDMLKLFGAGALIAPVAAEGPVARIIEPPKVELFDRMPEKVDFSQVESCSVRLVTRDGKAHEIAFPRVAFGSGKALPVERGWQLSLELERYERTSPSMFQALVRAYR